MRLGPEGLTDGYGTCRGTPLLDVVVETGLVGPAEGDTIWHLRGEVAVPGGPISYDQRLVRTANGTYVIRTAEASLRVDTAARRITVEAERESLFRQLVTTYGLPILLELCATDMLVLHACAAVPPGGLGASVICASSGTGKSSLLVGLIEAGWRAVTEDVSVVDLRRASPVVWAGPPWVRRADVGPSGSTARFETRDKTAWDITPWLVSDPVEVAEIVFLQPAGGTAVSQGRLEASAAIRSLAHSTVWLIEHDRRAAQTFGPITRVASSVPASTLRLPISDDWLDVAVSVLAPTR